MPPITYRNVDQLDTRGSNILLEKGMDTISKGLKGVTGYFDDRLKERQQQDETILFNQINKMSADEARAARENNQYSQGNIGNANLAKILSALEKRPDEANKAVLDKNIFDDKMYTYNNRDTINQFGKDISSEKYQNPDELLKALSQSSLRQDDQAKLMKAFDQNTKDNEDRSYTLGNRDYETMLRNRATKQYNEEQENKAQMVAADRAAGNVLNSGYEDITHKNQQLRNDLFEADGRFTQTDDLSYEVNPNLSPEEQNEAGKLLTQQKVALQNKLTDPNSQTALTNLLRGTDEFQALDPMEQTEALKRLSTMYNQKYNLGATEAETLSKQIGDEQAQVKLKLGYMQENLNLLGSSLGQQGVVQSPEQRAKSFQSTQELARKLAPEGSWINLNGEATGQGGTRIQKTLLDMYHKGINTNGENHKVEPWMMETALLASTQTEDDAWFGTAPVVDEVMFKSVIESLATDKSGEAAKALLAAERAKVQQAQIGAVDVLRDIEVNRTNEAKRANGVGVQDSLYAQFGEKVRREDEKRRVQEEQRTKQLAAETEKRKNAAEKALKGNDKGPTGELFERVNSGILEAVKNYKGPVNYKPNQPNGNMSLALRKVLKNAGLTSTEQNKYVKELYPYFESRVSEFRLNREKQVIKDTETRRSIVAEGLKQFK